MLDESEWSPQGLWEAFDPEEADLQCEVLGTIADEHGTITELTFFSHECEGEPIIAYGILGVPNDAVEVPGILHIHGGGQTANIAHVRRWMADGYACLTFDWTGPKEDRKKVTNFGLASTDKSRIDPSPEFSHLYHATAIARRALTLLASQDEVDGERLGIFGISWGGFLSWLVNGTDDRVKAAVAIYGCGGTLKWGNAGGDDFDPENEDQRHWSFCFSPYQYASLQRGPMLFLNCTNDFFGWMDTAEELFEVLDVRHAAAFCPHHNHHLDDDVSNNLYEWMASHLNGEGVWWPVPELSLKCRGGRLFAEVLSGTDSDEIEDIEIVVASNHVPSPSRYWHPCPAVDEIGAQAIVPIVNPDMPHSIYATVFYDDGTCISSVPQTFTPSDVGRITELEYASLIIDDFKDGIGGWFLVGLGTEPFPEVLALDEYEGPEGDTALTLDPLGDTEEFGWTLATRRLADLRWAPYEYEALRIVMNVESSETVHVRLTSRPGMSDAESFTTSATVDSSTADIELKPEQFKGSEDIELESFEGMHLLEIIGKSPSSSPPFIKRVEWV